MNSTHWLNQLNRLVEENTELETKLWGPESITLEDKARIRLYMASVWACTKGLAEALVREK